MSGFEKINIADIVPASYNPRKINNTEYNKLSNSISEFGVINPIILNLKNNHIIGGHQRYDVLYDTYITDGSFEELYIIRLGDIGWVFPSTDLKINDLSTEKAMNLALNKISGEWDTDKLETLLIDLDVDDYDLDLTGFDNMDLREFDIDLKHGIRLETPQDTLKKALSGLPSVKKDISEDGVNQKVDENVTVYGDDNLKEENNTESIDVENKDKVNNNNGDEVVTRTVKTIVCPECGFEITKEY